MSIGERIAQKRKEIGFSQGDVSKALHVSRQAVSKWENDLASPDTVKLIQLADLLDTDVEFLSTGRESYGRRPPRVITTVQTVKKIVEKPVPVEKTVVEYVEKPVVQFVEKPVIKKVERVKYIRNPIEFFSVGLACLIIGVIIGLLI